MFDYYLFAGIAAFVVLALIVFLIVFRRIRGRDQDDEAEDETRERLDVFLAISKRVEALEAQTVALRDEIERQAQEYESLLESREMRVEETLLSLQKMLEERMAVEERYPIVKEIARNSAKNQLHSIGNERFLNDAAKHSEVERAAMPNSEKNVKVRRLHRQGYTTWQIAQELGVSTGEVKLIVGLDSETGPGLE